jgi:hypothetical protein
MMGFPNDRGVYQSGGKGKMRKGKLKTQKSRDRRFGFGDSSVPQSTGQNGYNNPN